MRVLCLCGLMLLVFSGVLCAAPLKREVKETKIIALDLAALPSPVQGPLQWRVDMLPLFPSADLRHIAYVLTEGEKSCLVRDGVHGPMHDQVYTLPTSRTADGHFYYWLRDGEQWTLVFDEKEYRAASPAMMSPFVSPDGKHIAYIGKRAKNERCVVFDGVEGQWYYEISRATFSPDGQHFGYAANTGMRWKVVLDGKELPVEANGVENCVFSPDSQHFAAVLRDNNTYTVQIDGVPGKSYDRIAQLSYTPAGQLRYVAKSGEQWYLVTGTAARELPGGYLRDLVVSADEQHLAFVSGEFRRVAAVIDGVTGPTYLDVRFGQDPFSDGHVSYLAQKVEGWVSVVDGKETPLADDNAPAPSSRAGRRPARQWDALFRTVTSPDGKHRAMPMLAENKAKMLVDDSEGTAYDYISTPYYSADSRHLAYFARSGDNTMLVIDGQEGRACEAVITPRLLGRRPITPNADPIPSSPLLLGGPELFTSATQLRYLVYRDKAIYLVEETLR